MWTLVLLATATAGPDWTRFVSDEGAYRVWFPAAPTIEAQADPREKHKAQCTFEQSVYYVGYARHESLDRDASRALATTSLDAFSKTVDGVVTEQRGWRVRGNRGLSAMVDVRAQEMTMLYSVVLVGQRHYQLVVGAPRRTFDRKMARKFRKGFKLFRR